MKELTILSVLFILCSCQQETKRKSELAHHELHPGCKHEEELSKARDTFDLKLLDLYNSDLSYQKTIVIADSLIIDLRQNPSKLMSEISNFCIRDIHYFKGELFYKNYKYNESIEELTKANSYRFFGSDEALGVAANYIKLKEYEKARVFIDSSGKGNYLYDLALGNYYESVNNKIGAIKIYQKIVDEKHTHRFYYQTAVSRLQELEKQKPVLLEELIFPTRKPGAETLSLP